MPSHTFEQFIRFTTDSGETLFFSPMRLLLKIPCTKESEKYGSNIHDISPLRSLHNFDGS